MISRNRNIFWLIKLQHSVVNSLYKVTFGYCYAVNTTYNKGIYTPLKPYFKDIYSVINLISGTCRQLLGNNYLLGSYSPVQCLIWQLLLPARSVSKLQSSSIPHSANFWLGSFLANLPIISIWQGKFWRFSVDGIFCAIEHGFAYCTLF